MKICANCSKETNSNYLVRQYGILCGECAKHHGYSIIDELQESIRDMQHKINSVSKEIKEAITVDCEHKFESTGYGIKTEDGIKDICYCLHCGLESRR